MSQIDNNIVEIDLDVVQLELLPINNDDAVVLIGNWF